MTDADLLRTPAELASRDLSAGLANAAGLARVLGCSRAHAAALTAREGFPEPIPLVGGSTRYRGSLVWPVAEVRAWVDERRANPPTRRPSKRKRRSGQPVVPLYPPPGPVEIPPRP